MLSSALKVPVPFWKDPIVWACTGVAMMVLGVQAVRVGLLQRTQEWWQRTTEAAATAITQDNDNLDRDTN